MGVNAGGELDSGLRSSSCSHARWNLELGRDFMGLTKRGDDRDAGDQNQRQHDGALHRRGPSSLVNNWRK